MGAPPSGPGSELVGQLSQWSVDIPAEVRLEFLALHPVCGICGHPIPPGTGQIDHIISPKQRPDLAWVVSNWQAAHGIKGCTVCPPTRSRDKRRNGKRRKCNQAKGDRPLSEVSIPVGRTW